jgi:hypothetical protein
MGEFERMLLYFSIVSRSYRYIRRNKVKDVEKRK